MSTGAKSFFYQMFREEFCLNICFIMKNLAKIFFDLVSKKCCSTLRFKKKTQTTFVWLLRETLDKILIFWIFTENKKVLFLVDLQSSFASLVTKDHNLSDEVSNFNCYNFSRLIARSNRRSRIWNPHMKRKIISGSILNC